MNSQYDEDVETMRPALCDDNGHHEDVNIEHIMKQAVKCIYPDTSR